MKANNDQEPEEKFEKFHLQTNTTSSYSDNILLISKFSNLAGVFKVVIGTSEMLQNFSVPQNLNRLCQ